MASSQRAPADTPQPPAEAWRTVAIDLGVTAAVAIVVTIAINVSADPGSGHPADARAYISGMILALPVLIWRRRPLTCLLASAVLMFAYYAIGNPGIPPSPVFAVPLYAAAAAGWLRWAIGVSTFFYTYGLFDLWVKEHQSLIGALAALLPHIALAAATILLGEVVRNRKALADETRERLRMAEEEREREAARRVAEERVRIARELHDTVAHSMATITVQAASALHVLADERDEIRSALTAIRDTSKGALRELRATLGVLRDGTEPEPYDAAGLDRLPALLDAVRAAGVPVTLEVRGRVQPLEPSADHSAYRILQESLTNVLRHGGPKVSALVRMSYDVTGIAIEVSDNGSTSAEQGSDTNAPGVEQGNEAGGRSVEQRGDGGGHGLGGMRERAESVGGTLTAGPRPGGGFVVSARLPLAAHS